jgi:hypothetical protein
MKVASASILMFVGALGVSVAAHAQTRMVFVNGQRLNDAQVAGLEQRACRRIPNGQYWINMHTGAWGMMGDPRARGTVGDECGSLSQRRKLYRPGEILSQ